MLATVVSLVFAYTEANRAISAREEVFRVKKQTDSLSIILNYEKDSLRMLRDDMLNIQNNLVNISKLNSQIIRDVRATVIGLEGYEKEEIRLNKNLYNLEQIIKKLEK